MVRDIIILPNSVFENIRNDKLFKEVYTIFCIGALITFLKTFMIKQKTITFFNYEKLNVIISWLSIPQIYWFMSYLSYFIFILCLFTICKFFNKQATLKTLVVSLMSISGIGVVLQVLFYILKFIMPKNFILISTYLVYFWVIILSISAIKTTQDISFPKAIICFLLASLPFVFLALFVSISPYLAWLNV